MLRVFQAIDKTYSTNGDLIINPTKAEIHKEDNGDFYLDLETIFDEKNVNIPAQQGITTSSSNGFLAISDNDISKQVEITNIEGNTTQSGTPTPSTPQAVNVVSGSQNITVCGKNLYNKNVFVQGTWQSSSPANRIVGFFIPTKTGQKYRVTLRNNELDFAIGNTTKNEQSGNTQVQSDSGWQTTDYTYTITGDGYLFLQVKKRYGGNLTPSDLSATDFQVELGETGTTFEEYKGNSYEINLGKNLFDKSKITEGKRIDNKGIPYTDANYSISDYIVVEPNTTYIRNLEPSVYQCVALYRSDKTFISRSTSYQYFTTSSDTYYIRFSMENDKVDTTQLEKGNQITTYAPYKTPIELCKIGDYQDFIKKGTGKNLFDNSNNTSSVYTISVSATSPLGSLTCYEVQLEANTNYTLTVNMNGYTKSNEWLAGICYTDGTAISLLQYGNMSDITTKTFTTDSTGKIYIGHRYGFSNTNRMPLFLSTAKIQIEKGSEATSYEPYGMYNKWYIEKNIGKVVLNGSENWGLSQTQTNTLRFGNTTILQNGLATSNNKIICNMFTTSGTNDNGDYEHIRSAIREFPTYLFVLINKTRLATQDVAGFKSWLSTHNTTVYYILNTPTYTEITDSELIGQLNSIQLLSGLNNIIISSADLVGQITIRYNYLDAITNSIKYVDYLVPNNIIVANTPQGEQAFRISNVDKTRRKIKLKAYHVFYDSENYLIEDSYVVDKNCNDALDHLNNATSDTSPFTTISNVTTIDSYRCVRKSLFEAIQVVIERWGGHLVRDNWTIGIYNTIGQDNGVTIRYGKNLKDITASYNWDEVVTKLLPVGKDGILLNALDPTTSIYVESTIQYDIPYTKKVSFEQDNISEDDYKDEQGILNEDEYKQALVNDLSQKAQNYVQNNSVPKVNYTLSANVEKVSDIGDTIEVIDEKLGINIMTNIISYDYNCILDKYIQIEFGNFTPQLSGLINTISAQTQQIVEEGTSTIKVTLSNELKEATSQIWNALGNSYVIYEGDKILIVDSLPKETATNVIMINNGGIGFSQTGITGTFQSAWTIDNVLNMEQINVINLTADLIKGGTLKLGSNLNQNGQIEVYDESNSLIAELNKNGLKMYGVDGSYVLINNNVGFAGYDRNNNLIYWVNGDEFHMKKSVVEEEITLCNKMRFIPIVITDSNNNIINDGIGLVSVAGGGN